MASKDKPFSLHFSLFDLDSPYYFNKTITSNIPLHYIYTVFIKVR